jgi:prepilin-type N-terminal cleavage/methylation domain-containing protein
MKKQSARAFTLVEIMVVLAIIFLFSAILFLVAGPGIARAKTQPSCSSNLRQQAVIYNLYATDNDDLSPSSLQYLYTAKVDRNILVCPLSKLAYRNMVDVYNGYQLPGFKVKRSSLPDGFALQSFDPQKDVLVRCLDHGFDGFSRQDSVGLKIDQHTKGKVLGVRMNGQITKVAPLSCWEFIYWEDPQIEANPTMWAGCDGR